MLLRINMDENAMNGCTREISSILFNNHSDQSFPSFHSFKILIIVQNSIHT